MSAKNIIFITGTDTGVGKTLLTALLLHHLRQSGVHALAMKPFCSGGTADVRLLQSLQPGELTDAEMNPFYFEQPIAPLVASGKKPIQFKEVLDRIKQVEKKCDVLLIEGSGGLLVPLGKGFTVGDIIAKLQCRVIVAARNRLGTINHTLLTIRALRGMEVPQKRISVTLMSGKSVDLSTRTNLQVISKMIKPITIQWVPFLGIRANTAKSIKKSGPKLRKTLAKIIG